MAVLFAGALAFACSQDEPSPRAEPAREPRSTTPTPKQKRSPAPSPIPSDEGGGEESDDSVDAGERPEPERGLDQGGIYYGVYFALADDPEDPSLEAAVKRLERDGYVAGSGQLGCDRGAAEALGAEEDDFAVGLYFSSEDDAERFAELSDPPPLGRARVKIFCAD